MRRNIAYILFCLCVPACIGTDILDDYVEPEIVITNGIASLQVGQSYKFNAVYRNTIGISEMAEFEWNSSMPSVITIMADGTAMALSAGSSIVSVSARDVLYNFELEAGDTTSGTTDRLTAPLMTVSSYPLSGTAQLKQAEDELILELLDDFTTTSALPGLYVYLSNNPSSIANALEVAMITQFSGAQTHVIPTGTALFDYKYVLFFCKPFVVPVGNGELSQ